MWSSRRLCVSFVLCMSAALIAPPAFADYEEDIADAAKIIQASPGSNDIKNKSFLMLGDYSKKRRENFEAMVKLLESDKIDTKSDWENYVSGSISALEKLRDLPLNDLGLDPFYNAELNMWTTLKNPALVLGHDKLMLLKKELVPKAMKDLEEQWQKIEKEDAEIDNIRKQLSTEGQIGLKKAIEELKKFTAKLAGAIFLNITVGGELNGYVVAATTLALAVEKAANLGKENEEKQKKLYAAFYQARQVGEKVAQLITTPTAEEHYKAAIVPIEEDKVKGRKDGAEFNKEAIAVLKELSDDVKDMVKAFEEANKGRFYGQLSNEFKSILADDDEVKTAMSVAEEMHKALSEEIEENEKAMGEKFDKENEVAKQIREKFAAVRESEKKGREMWKNMYTDAIKEAEDKLR